MKLKLTIFLILLGPLTNLMAMEANERKEILSKIKKLCLTSQQSNNNEISMNKSKEMKLNPSEKAKRKRNKYAQVELYKKIQSGKLKTEGLSDINNRCPFCWDLCSKNDLQIGCCGQKFHAKCLIKWIKVTDQIECVFCETKLSDIKLIQFVEQ